MLVASQSFWEGVDVRGEALSLVVIDNTHATIQVVSGAQAGDSPITGDFGSVGSTSFGGITVAAWSTSSNNDISLSAAGILTISKTAKSKFAVRTSGDIASSTPTNPGNKAQFTTASVILSVTYSAGGTLSPSSKYW